jgi:hypothetical protein
MKESSIPTFSCRRAHHSLSTVIIRDLADIRAISMRLHYVLTARGVHHLTTAVLGLHETHELELVVLIVVSLVIMTDHLLY